MPDLNVIKFEENGHPKTGLDTWEAISPDTIHAGSPVQCGYTFFSTEADKLTAGVWDCTEHELIFEPYEVDEFMHVIEGSITLKDKYGSSETYRAGESFIIPKGTECAWTQSKYARKFWVILDDAGNQPANTADLSAIRIDTDAELPAVTEQDAALYLSQIPEMGWQTVYKDQSGKFEVGIRDCSPMKRVPTTLARSELMHILEGSGSITNADGIVFEFQAGDTFLVPIGMGYQWQNDNYVKKVFCSYTP